MASYYDILEISITAGNQEIKAAFRRLAKLYHPDKNPNGKEYFEKILMAYEVLINVNRRKQYDLKLKYGSDTQQTSAKARAAKKKEWNFSEEELKRRQYFKENYKKEYQQFKKTNSHSEVKIYNEYKYILFAAPLAVALFLFIVNSYEKDTGAKTIYNKQDTVVRSEKVGLNLGDDPYSGYFKSPVFDPDSNKSITLKNLSGYDVVICFFGKQDRFLRCYFLKDNYSAELSQLPKENIVLKMVFGKDWNRSKEFKNAEVVGGFEKPLGYFILKNEVKNFGYPITLDQKTLKNLEPITEKEFFEK